MENLPEIAPNDTMLQNLNIEDIVAYLKKTGWKPVPYPNKRLQLFEGSSDINGDPIEVALPSYRTLRDADIHIADTINLLSAIEEVPPAVIITKIRNLYRDTLRLRILHEDAFVSMHVADTIVSSLRKMISFAASMEEKPSPFFTNELPIGKEQSKQFCFGHTFQGSFGFAVEGLLSPNQLSRITETGPLPLERRIMERIIRGLTNAQKAIQCNDIGSMVENYRYGFNANLCETLATMMQTSGMTMEYSVIWSPELNPSDDIPLFQTICLNHEAHQIFSDAAHILRRGTGELQARKAQRVYVQA